MFESAELGHTIDKKTFDAEEPKLRRALLDAQYRVLSAAKFPVVLVIAGVDGAGKGETVNVLNEWMDARHIEAHAITEPSDEERERPHMWRFWRSLPPKGKLGIFFGSWYTQPIVERVYGHIKDAELDRRLDETVSFEKMLTDEGVLLLKFWFHLSKKAQKKRLHELEADKKTSWRVTESDWEHFERYDKFKRVSEHALRETSRNAASWLVIEGTDDRYRKLTAGKTLLDAINQRLEAVEAKAPKRAPKGKQVAEEEKPKAKVDVLPEIAAIDHKRVVDTIDLTKKLDKDDYEDELDKWQRKLNILSRHRGFGKISVVVGFEGSDAAGKGGTIRRLIWGLDARQYRVIQIAAPTEEERAQPYLWRFWRHLPRLGRFAIFDRTWYGRVLVERVEGYAQPQDWMRAYAEINDFEEQLARHGTVVAKFWLQISKEEQLRRFKERERVKYKNYKIGPDDWRNRKKWDDYELAMCDMVDRTSTEIAPWALVSSEDKYWARIKVLETLCKRIEDAL
jgi:AMP-polyphosphate phosphotransferase